MYRFKGEPWILKPNQMFLSIILKFVKRVLDHVKCISRDVVSVFGHLIGYEDIYKCETDNELHSQNG